MGQKVHPRGFRLGVIESWDSKWYARREYRDAAARGLCKLRKFLKQRLYHAGISKVEIERAANKAKINIYTARPGIVIGKKGAEIEKLKAELSKLTKKRDASSTSTRCAAPISTRSWWPRTSRCSSSAASPSAAP